MAATAHTPPLGPTAGRQRGEVFTRPWVVDLILDLAGYTSDHDLASLVAVEPSCGRGAFIGPMVTRLSASCRTYGRPLESSKGAIRAMDLDADNVSASRHLALKILVADGWTEQSATSVVDGWINQGDYLLSDQTSEDVDFVVGNPPYIRLEDVPSRRMADYRTKCRTMTGRSDIYVGFYEVALRSLKPNGTLSFICADRWMRNQYGRNLRDFISAYFSVDVTIVMHDVDVFDEQVSAYPAISVLRRAQQGPSVVANTTQFFMPADSREILAWVREQNRDPVSNDRYEIARLPHWFDGPDSWPWGKPSRLAVIEDLNDRFRPLEDEATGTRVGIGVATGADSVFVTKDAGLVEEGQLLRLAMVRDTATGGLKWSGHYLVNPWSEHGTLIDLDDFPRLKRYYRLHAEILGRRHVAVRRPAQWYRTIDKVDHTLIAEPKLLFPDMKAKIHPVLDMSGLYPHHNLYYVVSRSWDLRVLGGLLLSRVAEIFVDAYAVKMRGGYLRFQAQYLRRIRVPHPDDISEDDRVALANAFEARDVAVATRVAMRIYGIDGTLEDL